MGDYANYVNAFASALLACGGRDPSASGARFFDHDVRTFTFLPRSLVDHLCGLLQRVRSQLFCKSVIAKSETL